MRNLIVSLVIVAASSAALSAEDRLETPASDRQITHQIHSAIVADDSLPYCAHIVNVNSKNGKVILKGRVHTQQQKEKITHKAADIAGDENVTNQVAVTGS